jgi:hypothetical protein
MRCLTRAQVQADLRCPIEEADPAPQPDNPLLGQLEVLQSALPDGLPVTQQALRLPLSDKLVPGDKLRVLGLLPLITSLNARSGYAH